MSDHQNEQASLFSIRQIRLAVESEKVVAPRGIVYSTSPWSALDSDGVKYIVKGPEPEVVVPESAAYLLAKQASLTVPNFALATLPNKSGLYFASEAMLTAIRDVEPFITSSRPHVLDGIACITLFDIWIGNTDRNLGNLLAAMSQDSPDLIAPVAIDFEKAVTLRDRHPNITSGQLKPSELWPSGKLGDLLIGAALPEHFLAVLESIEGDALETIVNEVATQLSGQYDWAESTLSALSRRQARLRTIAQEAWR